MRNGAEWASVAHVTAGPAEQRLTFHREELTLGPLRRFAPPLQGALHMKPASMISGLYETHLPVADLQRSMRFYGDVLGLELALRDETRALAFYWIGPPGRSFVGLWQKRPVEIITQHFAFEVALGDLERGIASLTARGVPVRNFFEQPTDVPSVFGWIPAASIYFDDPDGHLLELIARLPGPPRPERGIVSLPEWLGG